MNRPPRTGALLDDVDDNVEDLLTLLTAQWIVLEEQRAITG